MKKLMYLVLIITPFLLISCSSDLSRSKAKEQILAKLSFPQNSTQTLHEYDSFSQSLIDKGLIVKPQKVEDNSSNNNSSGGIYIPPVSIQLGYPYSLTNEGKKYLLQYDSESNPTVILADIVFGDITGIIKNDPTTTEVQYTLKYTKITPFGEVILNGKDGLQKVAYFKKYDDGWRME